jgi:hypothetical protein
MMQADAGIGKVGFMAKPVAEDPADAIVRTTRWCASMCTR